MSSLRAELTAGGSRVPAYRMLVPPGWEVFDLSDASEAAVISRAETRLRSQGRGDLAAAFVPHVREALSGLRKQNAFAYAFAGEASPTWGLGTASLVGLKRISTPELSLDDVVRTAIVSHAAAPLAGDERIVRWIERRPVTLDGQAVTSLMLNYMIPVPGTRRTQAVHWVVNVAHDPALPDDHESLKAWELLFDGHVATFSWVNDAEGPGRGA